MMNLSFYEKMYGCKMGRPLSVMFFNIYMTQTAREVVKLTNATFYKRFVFDIINKRKKKDQPDSLVEILNNHTPISSIPMKQWLKSSLALRLVVKTIKLKPEYPEMIGNFLSIGHQRFQNDTTKWYQC